MYVILIEVEGEDSQVHDVGAASERSAVKLLGDIAAEQFDGIPIIDSEALTCKIDCCDNRSAKLTAIAIDRCIP